VLVYLVLRYIMVMTLLKMHYPFVLRGNYVFGAD
jgi:hypothetical protein